MQTPGSVSIAPVGQLSLLIGFLALGLLMGYLSSRIRNSRRAVKLDARHGQEVGDEISFLTELLLLGMDPAIGRTVYRYLRQKHQVRSFILPQDRLGQDLGLGDAEVTDLLRHVLHASGREQQQPERLRTPILTVHDLLRHVQQASPSTLLLAA